MTPTQHGRTCWGLLQTSVAIAKKFSGDPFEWEELEWNFKSYLAIFQPDAIDFLVRVETSDVEIIVIDAHFATALQQEEAVEMRMFCRKLQYLLADVCTGSARFLFLPECSRKRL